MNQVASVRVPVRARVAEVLSKNAADACGSYRGTRVALMGCTTDVYTSSLIRGWLNVKAKDRQASRIRLKKQGIGNSFWINTF